MRSKSLGPCGSSLETKQVKLVNMVGATNWTVGPVGALLDILQRTGVKGYTAFLESLELDYPQLYSRITGKEPNKTFSILIGLFTCLPVCLPVYL